MTSEITCERTLPTSYDFKSTSTTPRSSPAPNSPHVGRFENNKFKAILHNEDSNSDVEEKTNEGLNALSENTRSLDVSSALTRGTSSLSIEDIEKKVPSPVPLSYPCVFIEDNRNKEYSLVGDTRIKEPSPVPSFSSRTFTDNDQDESLLLTSIVWVNEKTHGWWPGKIISEDKSERPLYVRLFGSIMPGVVKLYDTSENHVLPFDSVSSTELRKEEVYPHKDAFNKALSEAMEEEMEDNDGLPSEYWALHKVVDSPNKRRKLGRKKLIRVTDSSGPEFSKDESLMIPGEPVLASVKNKYYPAQIVSYTEPDKYKVKFCYGGSRIISRKEFYTKYEDEFQTCQLGEILMDTEDPNYDDPKLAKKVHDLEEKLYRVLIGVEESAWRYQHFIEGGKKRTLLAEKVSPGPFNINEFNMIARVLIEMFVPGIAKSVVRHSPTITSKKNKAVDISKRTKKMSQQNDDMQSAFYKFSKKLQLRFVNDVLLPEAIIRLIMDDEGIDYEAAEGKMLMGYKDRGEKWVEDLMAERTSFQVGRESLRERT